MMKFLFPVIILFMSSQVLAESNQTRFFPIPVDPDSFTVDKVAYASAAQIAKVTISFDITPVTSCQDNYAGIFQKGVYNPEFTVVHSKKNEDHCLQFADKRRVTHEFVINMSSTEIPLTINNRGYILRQLDDARMVIVRAQLK